MWAEGKIFHELDDILETHAFIKHLIRPSGEVDFQDEPILIIRFYLQSSVGNDSVSYYQIYVLRKGLFNCDWNLVAILNQVAPIIGYSISTILMMRLNRKTQIYIFGSSYAMNMILLATAVFIQTRPV